MPRVLIALLALAVCAPAAEAEPHLVHAFDADSAIQSAGNGFAWTSADGHVRVTGAWGRTRFDVPGCTSVGATRDRAVLMSCAGGTEVLDTNDGTRQPVAVPGTPRAIGRWWIESDGPPRTYTNRHRDEQRTGPPGRDLDDPSLGKVDPPYRIRDGRLFVRRGAGWRAVARCHVACRDVLVWRRRAAFLDGRELVEHRPRHTTRWRVPSGVTLHRAGDTLVLQRGGEVWRADRG